MYRDYSDPGTIPARLLAVNIVGPFLDDAFRWLTPAASPGLPGRCCAPVRFSLFIIQTEWFCILRFFCGCFRGPGGLLPVGIATLVTMVPGGISPGALDVLSVRRGLWILGFFIHTCQER